MYKVIIVDDEPLAQDIIEAHISKFEDLELVAKCNNALEANKVLGMEQIDIMFLDIQMPQITGIDFLRSLANPPKVIFTTAYSEYAVEGFELNAVDYLLKPISVDRFMKAVNKAKASLKPIAPTETVEVVSAESDFFFVKSDKKLIKVLYSDILYIEGLKDYVMIKMDNKRIITLQTMKSLEGKLPQKMFKRIHRSFIVSLDKILALEGNMVELLEKGQKKHIPVGKNYRDELLSIINANKL